jgi:hypothetical protein
MFIHKFTFLTSFSYWDLLNLVENGNAFQKNNKNVLLTVFQLNTIIYVIFFNNKKINYTKRFIYL